MIQSHPGPLCAECGQTTDYWWHRNRVGSDDHPSAHVFVFVASNPPTCPCGGIILPDGKCVQGCGSVCHWVDSTGLVCGRSRVEHIPNGSAITAPQSTAHHAFQPAPAISKMETVAPALDGEHVDPYDNDVGCELCNGTGWIVRSPILCPNACPLEDQQPAPALDGERMPRHLCAECGAAAMVDEDGTLGCGICRACYDKAQQPAPAPADAVVRCRKEYESQRWGTMRCYREMGHDGDCNQTPVAERPKDYPPAEDADADAVLEERIWELEHSAHAGPRRPMAQDWECELLTALRETKRIREALKAALDAAEQGQEKEEFWMNEATRLQESLKAAQTDNAELEGALKLSREFQQVHVDDFNEVNEKLKAAQAEVLHWREGEAAAMALVLSHESRIETQAESLKVARDDARNWQLDHAELTVKLKVARDGLETLRDGGASLCHELDGGCHHDIARATLAAMAKEGT